MKNMEYVIRKSLLGLCMSVIILVIVLTNIGISTMFQIYLQKIIENENTAIADEITILLQDQEMKPEESSILRQMANQNKIHLVVTLNGKVVMDSSLSGEGNKKIFLSKEKKVLDYNELNYVTLQSETLSKMNIIARVGREDGGMASSTDGAFMVGINIIFITTLILAIFIAIFMSKYLSRKLSNPIVQIEGETKKIESGDYKNVSLVDTNTVELHSLSKATLMLASKLGTQEELRKRLTTDIAHELRSPLAVMKSQIEGMVDGVLEPTTDRLERLDHEIMRLTKLINDLNELSVVENDLYRPKFSEQDVTKLVKNLIEDFEPLFESKDIVLKGSIQEGIIAYVDGDRLRQIYSNLLTNAFKYTQKGTVDFSLQMEERFFIATITDTGMGIDKKDLEHVFERFYRADLSRNRETGGFGVGLAIVEKLVQRHGGTIKMSSELNVGTQVVVKIPIRLS